MKGELDDSNYEGMIGKLSRGTVEQKSACLNRFLFLYENTRSRIYLYQRRITECLQLLLLMEQKDIATCTLKLLQKIIINTTPESEIFSIVKKRLLSKMVLNLGSVDITTRKVSHKCILEFVRKSRDFDAIIASYVKTAIQQTQNFHLKLKSINSLHSLIIAQSNFFTHALINTQILLQQLIYASYQKSHLEIRRAALLCLIQTLRIDGSEKTLKIICSNAQKQLYDLKQENSELASLLQLIMKYKIQSIEQNQIQSEVDSAPSPKFMSFSQQDLKKELSQINQQEIPKQDKIQQMQLKILNDVSFAEQFLKRLQKTDSWEISQIKQFAPFLEKYLVDESIKLFSISKKIVQTIFDSENQCQRQYYVVLVPCVVNGIGNKRFIVRKNLDKLVRQYLKNHTEIWVQSFMEKFANTSNIEVKKILIDLFLHAYRTSPQFYHPSQRTFSVLEKEIKDYNSNLKWKAVDCLITVIESQAKTEKQKQDMMSTLSPEVYNKVLRKMNKTHTSIGSNTGSAEPLSPSQKMRRRQRRQIRLTTDEPRVSIERSIQRERHDNVSEQKYRDVNLSHKQRKARKSQIDIDFKPRKPRQQTNHGNRQQKQPIVSKLPELKRGKPSLTNGNSKVETILNESPVKKGIGEKNIMYVDKQNLGQVNDPKAQLQKALIMIRDNSWNTQFDSINSLRSVIEYHKDVINEEYFNMILTELLQCLNNLRSGVSKISLICLSELLRKFHKKAYPFTEQIISTLIKKNMTTSQFIQEQIKKCIMIAVDELCHNRMTTSINSLKQNSKGNDMKISILGIIEAMSKNERVYRKQIQWIWCSLIDFHEDHSFQVKVQARKIAKTIIESKKDWKNEISHLKPHMLEKIDKMIKGMMVPGNIGISSSESAWLEAENKQLNKIITSKLMTARYFANQFSKFEDQDRNYNMKKNFKDRSRLLNNMFTVAFQHSSEFEKNQYARKYIFTALDHLDEKNPGMLLNGITVLAKSIENFPQLMEECLNQILEKTLSLLDIKKVQIGTTTQKFIDKIYRQLDLTKSCKQLLKLTINANSPKVRSEALSHLIGILRQQSGYNGNINNNQLESLFFKTLTKLTTDNVSKDPPQLLSQSPSSNYISQMETRQNKIKQLIGIGVKRFSVDFNDKVKSNMKLNQIWQANGSPKHRNNFGQKNESRQKQRGGQSSVQKEKNVKKSEPVKGKIRLISSEGP